MTMGVRWLAVWTTTTRCARGRLARPTWIAVGACARSRRRASVRDAVCGVDRAPGAKSFREKVLVRGRVGQCRDYNAI